MTPWETLEQSLLNWEYLSLLTHLSHNFFYPRLSWSVSSVQLLSRVWLCNPMNRSTPGLPVHHQLLEFTQTHVHWVGDAIQPSHPLAFMIPHSKWSISVNYWFLPVSFSIVRAKHLYSVYFVAGAVQRNLPLFIQSSLQPSQEPLLRSHFTEEKTEAHQVT